MREKGIDGDADGEMEWGGERRLVWGRNTSMVQM